MSFVGAYLVLVAIALVAGAGCGAGAMYVLIRVALPRVEVVIEQYRITSTASEKKAA